MSSPVADNSPPPSPPRPQLQMIWPKDRLDRPPAEPAPDGYELRTYRESDEAAHAALMRAAGFTTWTDEKTRQSLPSCVPGGFFVILHAPTRALVATAMARHNPTEHHPAGGELGWVAGDPRHSGKRLGRAVCAAATRRFLEAGYSDIYLLTDDFRLAAIKIYLRLGFEPMQHCEGMTERWDKVLEELGWRQ